MKIKPEIILNSKENIAYKNILITGSDEAFISHIKNFIIQKFKNENFFIDFSNNYNGGSIGNLFSEKKTLFILSDFPKIKEAVPKTPNNQSILVASPNAKKTNVVKSTLTKNKDSLVVECYPLIRSSKENILKRYIETNNLFISKDVFWYLIENLDNNYVVFINQLGLLCLFNKKIELVSEIENIFYVDNKIEINKIFFNIFRENKVITNSFNKSINSLSDFYIFLNSTKLYIGLIQNSNNKESALYNFPKYLFAEKNIFSSIYDKTNKHKLVKIYRSLSKIELLVRQNTELYLVFGLRFFLNLKKIITS